MNPSFDITVLGGGIGGSIIALVARRLGYSVRLVEKHRHPRFAIGESSSPLANLLLDEIADEFDIPVLAEFSNRGRWLKHHSDVTCGLKRGFSFFFHELGLPFRKKDDRANELLVSASPHDRISDTHWYRSELDHFLFRYAEESGVETEDCAQVGRIERCADGFLLKTVSTSPPNAVQDDRETSWRTRFIIDATGPRGILFRAFQLGETPLADLPETRYLFTHFKGARRLETISEFNNSERPPYPMDAAAVHHLFKGGWIWVLGFDNEITSAGVSLTKEFPVALDQADPLGSWNRILEFLPSVRRQFEAAEPCESWHYSSNPTFRSRTVQGNGWAMLPSAAGFVDPLLSTGFPLTLLGIQRLGRGLKLGLDDRSFLECLEYYEESTIEELEATSRLISALYAGIEHPSVFIALTQLYFAAASFSETARRLNLPEKADSFLLCRRPDFSREFDRICRRVNDTRNTAPALEDSGPSIIRAIRNAVAPYNVAGLCDPAKRNWYPVSESDLFASAGKLEVRPQAIENMLVRAGFRDSYHRTSEVPRHAILPRSAHLRNGRG